MTKKKSHVLSYSQSGAFQRSVDHVIPQLKSYSASSIFFRVKANAHVKSGIFYLPGPLCPSLRTCSPLLPWLSYHTPCSFVMKPSPRVQVFLLEASSFSKVYPPTPFTFRAFITQHFLSLLRCFAFCTALITHTLIFNLGLTSFYQKVSFLRTTILSVLFSAVSSVPKKHLTPRMHLVLLNKWINQTIITIMTFAHRSCS